MTDAVERIFTVIYYMGDDEEKDDIVSCAATIASTVQGTMPYMRDM